MKNKNEENQTCVICEAPAVEVRSIRPEESELLRLVLGENVVFHYGLCQQCIDDPEHAQKAEAAILQKLTETRFKKEDFEDMDMDSLLDHTILYARLGWHVFPLYNPQPDGSCSCGKPDCNRMGSIHGSKNGRTKPLRMRISSGSGGRGIQKPTSELSPGRNPAFSYWISIQAQA